MGSGQQEDAYFLGVEKYPACNPRCYIVCVNYFTSSLSSVVGRFTSVLTCSACLDKIVSNHVKDSCISLINVCSCELFAEIFCVSVPLPAAWAYVIFGLPSVFYGATGLSFSCLGVFVK
jgi:hypothetical protein